MSKILFLGASFLSLTVLAGSLPANYESLKAEDKRGLLCENISKDPYGILPSKIHSGTGTKPLCPLDYGSWIARGLFLPGWLAPRFTYESDEMPDEDYGHPKAIHTYGVVRKVRWKPSCTDHPFTGLFRIGGIGIMRASLAKPYEPDDIYRPGMALKFFVEGKPSINFHVMHSLDGQGTNKNYFANVFSNIIAEPTGWLLKGLSIPFNWAIHDYMDRGPSKATELPLDEAARLESENWVAPFQIKFIPTAYAQSLLSTDDPESDLRKQLGMIQFDLNQPIYEILASTQEGEEYTVGELFLEGEEFIASEYGDTKLFFKHQRH